MSSEWTVQYHQRVLALNPTADWMLDEKSGTVAYDLVSGRVTGAQNGTHVSVTLGHPGIGDGRASSFYDGAASYTDVYSAAFAAAFNGAAGTVAAWAQVSAVGVWTDGVARRVFRFFVDVNNYVSIFKRIANNSLRFDYSAGGTAETVDTAGSAFVDWMHLAITWDKAADQMKAYLNGAQTGATQTVLGVWAGALGATTTVIGNAGTLGIERWSGPLAHCAVWNRALAATTIADLAVIE